MKFFLLCFCAVALATDLPGVQLQVNQRGINEAVRRGVKFFEQHVKNTHIDDKTGKAAWLYYEFTDIRVSTFDVNPTVTIRSPNVIELKAKSIRLEIEADYYIKGIFLKRRGSLMLKTNGAFIDTTLALVTASDGHLLFSVKRNFADIGWFSLTVVKGSILARFLSTVLTVLANILRPILFLPFSAGVGIAINSVGNAVLAKIPLDIALPLLAKGIHIDYHLTSAPAVTNNNVITVPLFGKFWYDGHQNDAGIPKASGVVKYVNSNEMICFSIDTDEVLGSAAHAFKYSSLSKIVITDELFNQLSPCARKFFDCFCDNGICLGKLIPAIQEHCPSSGSVTFGIETDVLVNTHFNKSGAYVSTLLKFQFNSTIPNGNRSETLFEVIAKTGVLLKSNVRMEGWKIKGSVSLTDAQLTLGSSRIGHIDNGIIEMLWKGALHMIVDVALNKIAENGIDLPPINDTTLVSPVIRFGDRFFSVCSDVA